MLTVATVLKSGGDYNADYVSRLAAGVRRNLNVKHRFVVLTDTDAPKGVQPFRLLYDWPGWWAKLEVFRVQGPLLYFDLDTVITGNIDALGHSVEHLHEWIMMRRGTRSNCASGIMGWAGDWTPVLTRFVREIECGARFAGTKLRTRNRDYRGDQDWIERALKQRFASIALVQDLFDGVYSYKLDVVPNNGRLPEDARIICFHGKPRPRDVNPPPEWLQRCWTRTSTEASSRSSSLAS